MVARAILSKSKRLGLGIVVGLTALWVVGVVSATPAGFDWGSFSSSGDETYGVRAGGIPVDTGSLVQLIWVGTDGAVDVPDTDGTPGDDDVLLDTGTVLNDAPLPPPLRNKGYVPLSTYTFDTEAEYAGGIVYMRAWDGPSAATSTAFGDSTTGTLSAGSSFNAPGWTVSSPTNVRHSASRVQPPSDNSFYAIVIFGLLSLLLVGVMVISRRRSRV